MNPDCLKMLDTFRCGDRRVSTRQHVAPEGAEVGQLKHHASVDTGVGHEDADGAANQRRVL